METQMATRFEFSSERFLIRTPVDADAARISACVNDAAMARNLARLPHPYGIEDARSWITYTEAAREKKTEYAFVVTDADVGVIGSVGFNRTVGEAWELGYWVAADWQGRGVATEAARRLLAWAEAEFGVTKFVAGHFQDNPASGRVLVKLGFQRVGEKLLFSLARGGKDPAWRYALGADAALAMGEAH
jgi:RimJ/RimL family protein N-acetyltransferase